jgi:hypothetical protein
MASRMVTSYGLQATQANEEPPPESSLDLTLTQHPHDEEPEPWEVHARLEVELAFSDELETICEGCYDTEDTSIFTWSSVPGVGHYRWLRGPIRRLPPNSKADYLVCTIRRILDFLQLWIITKA